MIETYEYLAHYGVKGQKWGVRKKEQIRSNILNRAKRLEAKGVSRSQAIKSASRTEMLKSAGKTVAGVGLSAAGAGAVGAVAAIVGGPVGATMYTSALIGGRIATRLAMVNGIVEMTGTVAVNREEARNVDNNKRR